jgi:hypothetical protein
LSERTRLNLSLRRDCRLPGCGGGPPDQWDDEFEGVSAVRALDDGSGILVAARELGDGGDPSPSVPAQEFPVGFPAQVQRQMPVGVLDNHHIGQAGNGPFLASKNVVSHLGQPTVDSLKSRLTPHALCLGCGKKLGSGSVSVIGQQHESKLAAHRAVPEVRDFLAATA